MHHIIRDRMKELKLTNEDMAERMSAHAITVSKLINGRMKMNVDWLQKFGTALEMDPAALLGELGPLSKPPRKPQKTLIQGTGQDAPNRPVREIPVYGLAAGSLGQGEFVQSPDAVEWIPAPPALASVRGAYALIVKGGSMEPRYFPGDMLYVHPHRPVRPGDHVVIERRHDDAQSETWVKRFKGEEKDQIVAEQYNPPAIIRFKRENVSAMHRILTINELFKVG